MPKLLIIADDLTGALDTGVKFAEAGLKTAVSTRCESCLADTSSDVAVLCADTRHLSGEEALFQRLHGTPVIRGGHIPLTPGKGEIEIAVNEVGIVGLGGGCHFFQHRWLQPVV